MLGNRRKSKRFRVPLDIEFMPLKGTAEYSLGKTRNFSREGLSFSSNSFDGEPREPVMVKFKLLNEYMYIYALGEIIWKKKLVNKYWVGIKVRKIDKESRGMKLDFPFNVWFNKEDGKYVGNDN